MASRKRDVGPGDGLLERIEVHDDKVNRLDSVGARGRLVTGVAAEVEQPAVDLGVQRFDTAIHHLRKARCRR